MTRTTLTVPEGGYLAEFATADALLAMLVASLGIGLAMSRLLLRPIRAIQATASRIGSDNLSERIPVPDVEDE